MTDLLSKYPMNDRSVSHFLCETDINCLQDIFRNKLMILFWFNAKLITNRKQFSHKCSYASVFHATDYSKRQGLFCLAMLSSTLSWIIVWTQLCFPGTQIQDNNHTKNARTRTSYWKGQQWFFNIIYSLWGMWLIHTKGESNPASQLREKSPLKHKQIALFIHEIFSASINLPCSSILINHSGCQGN